MEEVVRAEKVRGEKDRIGIGDVGDVGRMVLLGGEVGRMGVGVTGDVGLIVWLVIGDKGLMGAGVEKRLGRLVAEGSEVKIGREGVEEVKGLLFRRE